MLKFKDSSATQILREIKFGNFGAINLSELVWSKIWVADKFLNFHTFCLQLRLLLKYELNFDSRNAWTVYIWSTVRFDFLAFVLQKIFHSNELVFIPSLFKFRLYDWNWTCQILRGFHLTVFLKKLIDSDWNGSHSGTIFGHTSNVTWLEIVKEPSLT